MPVAHNAPASTAASGFYQSAEIVLMNLYLRWQDEKGHEDIADYGEAMADLAEEAGITIEKMTKHPFGCVFSIDDGRRYQISVTRRSYAYKRIY